MKVSDFIAKYLEEKGVSEIFELSGGMITHLLDSISQLTKIKIISMHHEQAASFAADGASRISGKPGISLATSGPGATNLLTGIANCYFDSIPTIFITGQVNTHELKRDLLIRQLGFQETDIISMAKPVCKEVFQISSPLEVQEVLDKAFKLSVSGRPGPVLIDIPMNIQSSNVSKFDYDIHLENYKEVDFRSQYEDLIEDLKKSKKPVILAGNGLRSFQLRKELNELINKLQIPVITTLLGLDVIPYSSSFRVGFIGSYGNRWANIIFGESDFVLVLGSRLDIRQTGANTAFFEDGRKIYHVDIDKNEINNRIKTCVPIEKDLIHFFQEFKIISRNLKFEIKQDWFDRIDFLRSKWPDTKELDIKVGLINPNEFMHVLAQKSHEAYGYSVDVGSHQMWAAQSLEIFEGQHFITSGGLGAMGYSLPAAIGASISLGNKPIVVILGDGCMQINIQELQTVVRNELPLKIIVLNNNSLGMIRQFQDSYFSSRYQSTKNGYSAPDFAKVANAYGITSRTIDNCSEMSEAVEWLWCNDNKDKPLLLQIMIDPFTNTYPKIAFGRPITDMEPLSTPLGMEST